MACANCGSTRHIKCCRYCTHPIPIQRREGEFCKARCQHAHQAGKTRPAPATTFQRVLKEPS